MMGVQELTVASRHRVVASSDTRGDAPLEVIVLHTTTKATLQALRAAARLAEGLATRIRLLVLEIVPYPLPLNAPQVPLEFTHRHFRTVVWHTSGGLNRSGASNPSSSLNPSIETHVDIRLGRDTMQMLESALKPHSLVVMAAKRSWWPTAEKRLAKRLEHLGHQVVVCSSN